MKRKQEFFVNKYKGIINCGIFQKRQEDNMKFLPYEDFEIKTSFSPYDSVNRLKKVTGSKRHFWFWQTPKTSYQGKIEGNQFEISRSIGYRNSFLPIIKGKVRSDLGGSSITISMQLHILVMVFMIFWLGSVGFSFITSLDWVVYDFLTTGQADFFSLLPPAGMFLFGYLLTMGGFKFEVRKSKKYLYELLNGNKIEERDFSLRQDKWELNQ
ncbi:MAG: hypothetical protein HN390_12420 [Anaerolineae bacterium]|jgi:hypothetical protein|nr:hypothetical protein [Anaerolineae bacterium]MBT7192087.1 hypothetical protein [Anaerolineae bacterium]MBT7990163.1 hypothetical protein [Anaerolineae bacterium]